MLFGGCSHSRERMRNEQRRLQWRPKQPTEVLKGDPVVGQQRVGCRDPTARPTLLNDSRSCQLERVVDAKTVAEMHDERRARSFPTNS